MDVFSAKDAKKLKDKVRKLVTKVEEEEFTPDLEMVTISFVILHPFLWWWRLIVFTESARRRHLFLLSLENPYSDYFQIFAVCILALWNLPGKFFFCVFQFLQQNPRWPPKSYGAL